MNKKLFRRRPRMTSDMNNETEHSFHHAAKEPSLCRQARLTSNQSSLVNEFGTIDASMHFQV